MYTGVPGLNEGDYNHLVHLVASTSNATAFATAFNATAFLDGFPVAGGKMVHALNSMAKYPRTAPDTSG